MSTDSRPGSSAGELPENLRASDIMVPVPRTCSPFSTITEAALILKDQGLGMVPVVDLGKPIGIVTDRDVAAADAGGPESGQQPVSDVMDRQIPTAPADTPIDQIPGLMADSGPHVAGDRRGGTAPRGHLPDRCGRTAPGRFDGLGFRFNPLC